MFGVLGAAALLLGAAGLAKVVSRAPSTSAFAAARIPMPPRWGGPLAVRLVGLLELVVAAVCLVAGGRTGSGLLALSYLGLACLSWRMVSVAPGQDCGCFGRSSPITHAHTMVNTLFAAAAAASLASPPAGLIAGLRAQPLFGVPFAIATLLLAYLSYVVMTVYPALVRARAQVVNAR